MGYHFSQSGTFHKEHPRTRTLSSIIRAERDGGLVMQPMWLEVFAGGLAAGAGLVGLLASRRGFEAPAFLFSLLGLLVSGTGVVIISGEHERTGLTLAAIGLGMASTVGGYGLASALLPVFRRTHRRPVLPATLGEASGTTDVVLVACCEPERYHPSAVAEELAGYSDEGLPEPGMAVVPFLYAAQKARYRAVGGRSPAAAQTRSLAERLGTIMSRHGGIGTVECVTCTGRDTLDAAVTRAVERGARRIIAVSASIGESHSLDRAKARVDLMRPRELGIDMVYATPLWGSDRLALALADRITTVASEPDLTGVALVMHGQPDTRQRTHGAFDVQENAFCNRIRMMLTEHGIPEQNIRLCYLDWREPGVTETVRHIAAMGCGRVIISPACFAFDSIATTLDLQVAVRQARVETHVTTVVLPAWSDDAVAATVLAEAIDEALPDLAATH